MRGERFTVYLKVKQKCSYCIVYVYSSTVLFCKCTFMVLDISTCVSTFFYCITEGLFAVQTILFVSRDRLGVVVAVVGV